MNVCADSSKNLTSSCTNEVAIANLAQIGANTVLGNSTAGTANVTALATTGTGSVVEATSPTLVTPALGTPSSLTLTNATGLPNAAVIGLGTFATANAATPPAIGGTTPAAGAFSTLSASSTVSGSGFSTYLASPPAIGGTAAAAVTATTLTASTINDIGLTASANVCADGSKNLTSSCTNEVAITNLAQIATNTVLGNATAGTANVVAQAMPSCSTGTSALIWTTSTGFGCNTLSALPANLTLTNPASAATLAIAGGQTLTTTGAFSPTLAFSDSTVKTFPSGAVTLAALSTGNAFTGANTFSTGTLNFSSTGTLQANADKLGSGTALSTCALGGAGTCSYTTTAGSFSEKITLASATGSTTTITLTFPNAVTNMYICDGYDFTTSTQRLLQTGGSTTTAVLTFYSLSGTAGYAGGAADVLYLKCMGN